MKRPVYWLTLLALAALSLVPTGAQAVAPATQSDGAYAASFASNGVTNVFATTQRTSCFTPEAPYFTSNGPTNGYTGMSPCNGASNTGENLGPYATQAGSNPGYPATTAIRSVPSTALGTSTCSICPISSITTPTALTTFRSTRTRSPTPQSRLR